MRPRRALDPRRTPPMLGALALALAATLAGCGGGGSSATAGARASSATGFDGGLLPAGVRAHPFTLTDQYGRRVSLRDFRGRVVVLAFLDSTSTTTAPLIAQQIRGALDELQGDSLAVSALAVSVDPAADTPPHVRAFLRANSLAGRLEYLTGSPAALRAVWRAYRVVPTSAGAQAYGRGAFVLLVDGSGAERVELPLEELTPEALAHDMRKLESK